jgi:hypothetical protein
MALTKVTNRMSTDNVVNVLEFGAFNNGTNAAATSVAIQAAIDTGNDVYFPGGTYIIDTPIKVGIQRLYGEATPGIPYPQTIIQPQGNIAAFEDKPQFTTFSIENFFINYGETRPVSSSGNDGKIGFKLTTSSGPTFPQFSEIKNCTVRGGWYGLYDQSGSYQTKFQNIYVEKCYYGFYKEFGTTIIFESCFSIDCVQGFIIKSTLSPSLVNCGCDKVTVDGSQVGNSANYFEGIRSLIIDGFDGETNSIESAQGSFMRFNQTAFSVSGFVGYDNDLTSGSGVEVYWFRANDSIGSFDGCQVALNSGDLAYTGTGSVFTLHSDNSKVNLSGCRMRAATGGSPAARVSVDAVSGGSVSHSECDLSGGIIGTGVIRLLGIDENTGNMTIPNGTWDTGHLILGSYHIWVDATGDLRIKSSAPTSDTDGTIVGTQS